jgi:hypothetical protein
MTRTLFKTTLCCAETACLAVCLSSGLFVHAQNKPLPAAPSPPAMDDQISQLRSALAATRAELDQYRQEVSLLRTQLQEIQSRLPASVAGSGDSAGPAYPTIAVTQEPPDRAATPTSDSAANEDQSLLAEKIDEMDQTKLESGSRYKVRVSGMVLMNAFSNRGGEMDIQDLPNLVFPRNPSVPKGDIGATFRQTLLGLEVTGPQLFGGNTSAAAQADFFGGFPETTYGTTAGLVRLRTATARIDWHNTSLIVGQDAPLISPLSPTSYATVAEPAFSWAGNLWVWTPQVRVEHHWQASETSRFTIQAGILDPLTEEIPDAQYREANPAERTRTPALSSRLSWSGNTRAGAMGLGFGTYYARQNYGFGRTINSWATTADWNVPLTTWLHVSGELYRGQALGGLGGGIWQSALFDGTPNAAGTKVLGLNDIGGWAQLKARASSRWEFNLAAGAANPFSRELQRFSTPVNTGGFTPLARNQSIFGNTIFRPRSNLLFALEYRRLRTYRLSGAKSSGDQVNLAVGVSF